MINRMIIGLNNKLTFLLRRRVKPSEILLLVPHCLQKKECRCDVVADIANCKACGKCRMADFLELQKELGVRITVANGGRQACQALKEKEVRSVVAVACEKELASGILTQRLRKRIYAVTNSQPNGPCRDTDVHMDRVREVLLEVVHQGQ